MFAMCRSSGSVRGRSRLPIEVMGFFGLLSQAVYEDRTGPRSRTRRPLPGFEQFEQVNPSIRCAGHLPFFDGWPNHLLDYYFPYSHPADAFRNMKLVPPLTCVAPRLVRVLPENSVLLGKTYLAPQLQTCTTTTQRERGAPVNGAALRQSVVHPAAQLKTAGMTDGIVLTPAQHHRGP